MNSITSQKLCGAINHVAATLLEVEPPNRRTVLDAATLVRVLAQIVEGKEVLKAFGAPGDWGYNTPIGKALFEALSRP